MRSFFAIVAVFSALCSVGMEDIAKINENTDKMTLLGIIHNQQNAIRELQVSNAAYVQLDKDTRDFVARVVTGIRGNIHKIAIPSLQQLFNVIADDLDQNLPTLQSMKMRGD
jgi:hypothetical protein